MKNEGVVTTGKLKDLCCWEDIYAHLREDIENGIYLPGTRLPTENELSTGYNVKRFVVRKAIEKLISDGLVFVIRNRGYYVNLHEINIRIRKENSYTQSMLDEKLTPRVKLFEIKTVRPDAEQKKLFHMDDSDILWEIYVLRFYKNIPFAIGQSFIPYQRVPEFNVHYTKLLSIHRVLSEVYGIKPVRKSSVCKSGISDKRESKLLSIFDHSHRAVHCDRACTVASGFCVGLWCQCGHKKAISRRRVILGGIINGKCSRPGRRVPEARLDQDRFRATGDRPVRRYLCPDVHAPVCVADRHLLYRRCRDHRKRLQFFSGNVVPVRLQDTFQ